MEFSNFEVCWHLLRSGQNSISGRTGAGNTVIILSLMRKTRKLEYFWMRGFYCTRKPWPAAKVFSKKSAFQVLNRRGVTPELNCHSEVSHATLSV